IPLLPPILTTPDFQYDLGWLGAVTLLCLLVVAALVAVTSKRLLSEPSIPLLSALLESLGYAGGMRGASRHRRAQLAVAAGGALVIIAVWVAGIDLRHQAEGWRRGP